MRRWRRMILTLMLALATTLVSAVGLSAIGRDRGPQVRAYAKLADGYHAVVRHRLLGAEIIQVQYFAGDAPAGSTVIGLPRGVRVPGPDRHDGFWATTIAYGFPFPFLFGSTNQPVSQNNHTWTSDGFIVMRDVKGADHPPLRPGAIYIPTRIFPLRFLGSALCWLLLWAAVLFVPVAARARARRGRNVCASCGYDREGLASGVPCPECGTAPAL